MAWVSSEYNVRESDVTDRLELETSQISETTVPLNLGHVRSYIEAGEAQMKGALVKAGLTSLDADTEKQVRSAIAEYAVAECLAKLGMRGTERHDSARAQWRDIYERYTNTSTLLIARSSNRTRHNIPDNPSRESRFKGRNYEF